jgi:uncharacterized Zn finger protein
MIYRVTATCEECGHRNVLERLHEAGEKVYFVCHECEPPLSVTLHVAEPARVEARG